MFSLSCMCFRYSRQNLYNENISVALAQFPCRTIACGSAIVLSTVVFYHNRLTVSPNYEITLLNL